MSGHGKRAKVIEILTFPFNESIFSAEENGSDALGSSSRRGIPSCKPVNYDAAIRQGSREENEAELQAAAKTCSTQCVILLLSKTRKGIDYSTA